MRVGHRLNLIDVNILMKTLYVYSRYSLAVKVLRLRKYKFYKADVRGKNK